MLKSIIFPNDTNLLYCGKYIKELDELCKWFQVNTLSVNTSTTNVTVFTNKSCDDTYSVCMNGLNVSRVFVTKLLSVHMDYKLDWYDHYV